jgi:PAS domain S-box-containing protein
MSMIRAFARRKPGEAAREAMSIGERRGESTSQGLHPYAVAAAAVGTCLALRLLFQPLLGLAVPYFFFFPGIMAAALIAGYRSGLLATALALGIVAYFFLLPVGSFRIDATADLVTLPLFVLSGWAISYVIEGRRRFEREYREAAAVAERHAEQLDVATARLGEIVANVPGVVWEAWGQPDLQTQRIDFVSGHLRTMLGYEPDEWTKVPNFWLTVVHPDDRERAASEARAIFESGRGGRSEFRWVHRDGHVVWVEAHSMVIRDHSGRPVGMRGVTLDVTERKRLERDLDDLLRREQHAREEAVRANQLKDEFLATLSHELRTPLNAVLGYAQMLRQGAIEPARRDHALKIVERNAASLSQLVSDVLDISRIAAGKVRLRLETVDVRAVLSEAVLTVRPAAEAKGVRLQVHDGLDMRPVQADPDRLQQIVWNLLSNAVRFTPSGGKVDVSLTAGDSHLEITVADTGIGISPEFLPHVFDRFRQADNRIAREHGGLGLGLAITRELVELHGGTIRASSDGADRGATFTVRIPAASARTTELPA